MRTLSRLCLLLLPLTLAGCGGGTDYTRSPVVTERQVSCMGDDASEIPAALTVYSPVEAKLNFMEKDYELKRVETASGVKYKGDNISFWNKGIDAMIQNKSGKTWSCRFMPRAEL